MAMLLKHLGHEPHTLFNGVDVAHFLQQTPVDLVILDVMMPGVNGMDVLKQLRADAGLSHVPIVMMTAVTDPLTKRDALAWGANDYWIKATIEMDELERRLTKLTSSGGGSGTTIQRTTLRDVLNAAVEAISRGGGLRLQTC